MSEIKNIIGKKFGRLTVISRAENAKNGHVRWNCLCDCGNMRIVESYSLRKGTTLSCGCYHKELLQTVATKHGHSAERLYKIWCNMKSRCNCPSMHNYKYYGGKGITYCPEWETFEPFYNWAMANGYRDNLTIDRIDSDLSYTANNCRWVTYTEQNNNLSRNHIVTYNNENHTIAEWCRILKINTNVVRSRLHDGWDEIKALTTPVKHKRGYNENN